MEVKTVACRSNRGYLEDFLLDFYTSGKKYIQIDSHLYAGSAACCWTIKQALITYCLDKYCDVCIRDGEVYLYNKEFKNIFAAEVKPAHRGRPKKIKEAPVKIYYVPIKKDKKDINIEVRTKVELPNSVILSNLTKLWTIGKELDNISIKNLGGKYYQIIEDTLKKFNNKLEIQNFADYASVACNDKDLLYVIQYISNNF